MIHYHGLPITPDAACSEVAKAGHVFVSHAYPTQAWLAVDLAQSFALDNGAFSAWRSGAPVTDSAGSGGDSSTTAVKPASTARSSAMSRRTAVQTSFAKRMRLLIASGLVCGITPTSTRRGSSQGILAGVFSSLDGGDAA